jgi:arylformamidase
MGERAIGRRGVVTGGAALAATAGMDRPVAAAQAATKAEGARVFLDYTQEELDRAYDQRVWAPNAAEVIKRYGTASEAVRAQLTRQAGLAYGPTEDETLDVFAPAAAGAPIHIFVHGGAWRGGRKDDYSFPAGALVPAGACFVPLNFGSIPKVRLPDMAAQVRRAIAWVYRNGRSFGGDPERIYLSGHSSGAHLAAVALTTDWPALGVPATVVKAGLCVSGMYDLRAPLLSARSAYVQVSREEEDALSPQRHLDRVRCPIAVAHGEKESPEFKRQAAAFASALTRAGLAAELAVGPGLNHFELLETLAERDGLLARIALGQMRLGG